MAPRRNQRPPGRLQGLPAKNGAPPDRRNRPKPRHHLAHQRPLPGCDQPLYPAAGGALAAVGAGVAGGVDGAVGGASPLMVHAKTQRHKESPESCFESGWSGWVRAYPGYPSNILAILIQISIPAPLLPHLNPDGQDGNGWPGWRQAILYPSIFPAILIQIKPCRRPLF